MGWFRPRPEVTPFIVAGLSGRYALRPAGRGLVFRKTLLRLPFLRRLMPLPSLWHRQILRRRAARVGQFALVAVAKHADKVPPPSPDSSVVGAPQQRPGVIGQCRDHG